MLKPAQIKSLSILAIALTMTTNTLTGGNMLQWEENADALNDPALFSLQDIIDKKALPTKKEAQIE